MLSIAAVFMLATSYCGGRSDAEPQLVFPRTRMSLAAATDDVYSRLGFGLGLGFGFVGALTLSASSVFGMPVPLHSGGRSVSWWRGANAQSELVPVLLPVDCDALFPLSVSTST